MPAYLTVVLVCAIFLSLLSTLPIGAYFSNSGVWKYIGANAIFMNFRAPELPGVFQNNTINAVNGALWTLKIEVAFYIVVPICVSICNKFGRSLALIAIYFTSVTYVLILTRLANANHSAALLELARQIPGQMSYFSAGAMIYYNFHTFNRYRIKTAVLGLVLFITSSYFGESLFRPLAVAFLIMSIAFGPYVGRFGRYGDFSYGIYIVHFPILQILVALELPQRSLTAFVFVSFGLVMLTAVLMWHMVEKRFLRRDSHYRREAVALDGRTSVA